MNTKIRLLTIFALASILFAGCYPNEDIYYSDTDIAVTRYDTKFIFEDSMVCVLFDTVAHVVDEDDEPQKGMNDAHIISEIARNLRQNTRFIVYVSNDSLDLKKQLQDDGRTVDSISLVVTTTVMESDYYHTGYYPWYPYWYWGWYPYWKSGSLKSANNINYYYYPWYPWGGGTYYAYSTGTIMIDMIDAKSIKHNDEGVKLPVVWNGVINGILSDNKSDQASRITTQVNQCFKQSPYLKK
jgi:hypothetical protein